MRRRVNLILFFICTLAVSLISAVAGEKIPFQPGEKLHFKVYWTEILAGEATLEVLPIEKFNGVPAYHFVMTVATVPFVDVFYMVRDRIESYTDLKISHTLFYKIKKEGKKKKEISTAYDWKKHEAQYSKNGKKRKPAALLPGAFDPLSVFYFFRMRELKENMEISTPVSDGKVCVTGKARVLAREKVTVASGAYDTFLVEPELGHIGGVFEKSPNAKLQIWVTADERRLPVKIKSEVAVGSFTAELDSIEGRK